MSGSKTKLLLGLALLPALALGACTVAPPTGPSIAALPGPGKSFAQFQHDDYNCQNYAQARMSGSAQQAAAASQSANGSAVVGTLLGAAAGAALGSLAGNVGAGAAIGAGAGLLGGASVAGGQAQSAADSMQGRYDTFYAQCMVGNGEVLQPPPPAPAVVYAPPPVYYYAPY
jgi:hypothetical protein